MLSDCKRRVLIASRGLEVWLRKKLGSAMMEHDQSLDGIGGGVVGVMYGESRGYGSKNAMWISCMQQQSRLAWRVDTTGVVVVEEWEVDLEASVQWYSYSSYQ
jgi:hypothetical protein